ncbi:hypothetical protein ACFQVC_27930, partial [Streptomyces monticola]
RAVCSADTTRRRYAAEETPRSARLAGDSVAGAANSVVRGSNCSAIRPAEIRSANFWGWLRGGMRPASPDLHRDGYSGPLEI